MSEHKPLQVVQPPTPPAHTAGAWTRHLLSLVAGRPPLRMAVVHPVDRNALLGALEATEAHLIVPLLIGPEARIRVVAEAEGVDLAPYTMLPTEHSHAAAEQAVALARARKVGAIMKGSLHTDELMQAAVAPGTGLTTDRRMSHVFVVDVPTYPRPLLVTDAALNIAPNLEAKRDIIQNAIDLAVCLGILQPKVALISAVETITSRLPSTLDAAGLCCKKS